MKSAVLAVLILLQSSGAFAQGYKCALPNGKVAFQDHPCQAGAVHTTFDLQTQPLPQQTAPTPAAPALLPQSSNDHLVAERQRLEANLVVRNAIVEARNRAARCDHARENLDALKLERRVYRSDDKGERHYIDDDARPAEIANTERYVAQNCK
ncbi:MAG: DUF4124 domain-containing protein [Gammaproteobacteria bacterium]|nr:DUF4124 domain-containing protein [Gammaproteobacteria bacterium]MBI5616800.1 DUF4124 domain-containing protein [Gammaproteobacteria bacterium]